MGVIVFAQDADTYVFKYLRRLPYLLLSEGVIPSPQYTTPMKVQAAGVPNMTVDVLVGDCIVQGEAGTGSFSDDYGSMVVTNDSTKNVTITAADGTNPRIDLIVVQCYDDGTGAGSYGDIIVVTGTPAGSPSVPSTPANAYKLAEIAVAAGVSSITNANITDRRVSAYLNQGMAVGASVYLAGNVSVSNSTLYKVLLDTEEYDVLGNFASNKFTAPVAGKYLITGQVYWAANATGDRRAYIYKNGVEFKRGLIAPTSGSASNVPVSAILDLAANDYIELYAYQNSGGNLTLGGGSLDTYLSIQQLTRTI